MVRSMLPSHLKAPYNFGINCPCDVKQCTPRSIRGSGKGKEKVAVTGGSGSGNSPDGGARSLSKDDYIKKLQAELEQLKAEQGIGSSSHQFMHSQSPPSKRKRGTAGQ